MPLFRQSQLYVKKSSIIIYVLAGLPQSLTSISNSSAATRNKFGSLAISKGRLGIFCVYLLTTPTHGLLFFVKLNYYEEFEACPNKKF